MITENLSTLQIHKLTQDQFKREKDAGNLVPTAIYLTPDEAPDTTLSVDGRPADSKAVGEALAGKQPAGDYALASDLVGLASETYVNEAIIAAIPTITEADEGKVLMVVNGKLQLVALSLSVDENGVVSV